MFAADVLTSLTKNVQRYARPTESLIVVVIFSASVESSLGDVENWALMTLQCSVLERTRPSPCGNVDSANSLQVA